jgi:hypothetical protein
MTMIARPDPQIPDETFQAARKMYNLQHVYLRIGDELETILENLDLTLFDPTAGLKQDMVFRLALVTAFQYAETLPDPAGSEATLKRMDWKYALYLPVQFPGIRSASLSEFRHNLSASPKGLKEFDCLLHRLEAFGLYRGLADRLPESAEVLSIICKITRINRLNQAMKEALGAIVSIDHDWLRVHALPHWYERYKTGRSGSPEQAENSQLLEEARLLGSDISWLLNVLERQNAVELSRQPEIRRLARLLEEEYSQDGDGLTWRMPGCKLCSCHHREEIMQ